MIYALDTSTISYYLRGEGRVNENFHQEIITSGNVYTISYFSAYEIMRWLNYKPTRITQFYATKFDLMFKNVSGLADMPGAVWDKAVEVYIALQSKGQLIGDADILIAAYCLVNDYTLVTRNISDFNRIDGLKVVNWFCGHCHAVGLYLLSFLILQFR